ncbi:hypothetical protein PPEP_b0353 [Pseudoalteromonas peptidolytica F12-50-A1]|uniref:Uncharacterized protein n=1 Tax=Pseudoalteromonas peptidolytica F12-50-A1 TaxID=1315280 RepID=A0A8I0T6L7_9GAMM|nr:hypothetical protein [Pseudoalteromonas peptidolytica F12-50-A1]
MRFLILVKSEVSGVGANLARMGVKSTYAIQAANAASPSKG